MTEFRQQDPRPATHQHRSPGNLLTHRPDEIPKTARGGNKDVTSPLDNSLLLLSTQTSNYTADTDPRWPFLLSFQY